MSAPEMLDLQTADEPQGHRHDIEIVVPAYNEEAGLGGNVRRLRRYLDEHVPFSALITIADNGSSDSTAAVAHRLCTELQGVRVVHLDRKGRGRALRTVWNASESPVVGYMDVDLSTDLDGLLPLVAPLLSGHSDVAIGTRLAPGSRVVRGARRETISRLYNGLLHVCLRTRFSDAQCGFKAVRTDVARALLPAIQDEEWFFDTELLVLAERNGFRIHEVPVDWTDDDDSRVDVVHTALSDLAGVWRLLRSMAARNRPIVPLNGRAVPRDAAAAELVRFVAIGSGSTLAYFVLFLALRPTLSR
jgi:glycosyltransferase involved in cell wall biosynthesis